MQFLKLKSSFKYLMASLVLTLAMFGVFTPFQPARALDVWSDQYSENQVAKTAIQETGLGNRDPREIIAGVIEILLGFLGVIAVCLIIYAGFLWMTANGDEAKVVKAQKLLKNAVIGLLIVLASFGIAWFVINRWIRVTGGTPADNTTLGCVEGNSKACGCGGLQACVGGSWGSCVGSDCSGTNPGQYCDSNVLTQTCDADNRNCQAGEYCNPTTCRCSQGGGIGSACSAKDDGTCEADNNKCGQYLTCDPTSCKCVGGPVIEGVTPQGGFCDGSATTPCLADSDCSAYTPSTCNHKNPNGAAGNLATIHGRYFGAFDATKSQVLFTAGSGFVAAPLAEVTNADCTGDWSDEEIIVTVPEGATEGPVKVETINGSDLSNDKTGPELAPVKINGLVRPGLCKLSKQEGVFGDKLDVYGINLEASSAFFGNFYQNYAANESIFTVKTRGSVTVPNIEARKTTTYVLQSNKVASNFLGFNKLADAMSGPTIIDFEPKTGPANQYVTIRGTGFGQVKGDSQVLLGDKEAGYNFPLICLSDVWNDNQIIVKVPEGLADGDKKFTVKIGTQTVESADSFKVNSKQALAPGICRLEPSLSKGNEEISVWGENFGNKDNNSKLIFHDGLERKTASKLCLGGTDDGKNCTADKDCDARKCVSELLYWGQDTKTQGTRPDKATTKIPAAAITGPVKLAKGANALLSNSVYLTIGQCSKDSQCGGTNVCCQAGSALAGTCQTSAEKCFGTAENCVFEWGFGTGTDNNCGSDRPYSCQDGSCCRLACVFDQTLGKTTCLDDESCAGYYGSQCLDSITCPNSPGKCSTNNNIKIQGSSCDCALLGLADAEYDEASNSCIAKNATCSLPKTSTDINGNLTEAYCSNYQGTPRWQIYSKTICPDGYTKSATNPNMCVDVNNTCDLCTSGYKCTNQSGVGVCASSFQVCPNGFKCSAGICTKDTGSCECCCDKQQNKADGTNPACCAPLSCDNSCGSGGDYGVCSGCANVGSTQDEHDAACNCTGTTGKFCDTSVSGGVCRDCSQIGDASNCSDHSTCCVNFNKGNACSGVKETRLEENGIAYCGFFNCGDNCANPLKSNPFSTTEECSSNCLLSCDGSDQPGCQKDETLCPPDKPVCNASCQCQAESEQPESFCASEQGQCSLFCGNIYTCRGELGCTGLDCAGKADESTCRCCCDPHKTSTDPNSVDYDTCRGIGKGNLACRENSGECSGNERGLCCGCSSDEECGIPEEAGCGKDKCCHSRLSVTAMVPNNSASGVCRNTAIRAEFSGEVDKTTLAGNVLVVGDFGTSPCPNDTVLLSQVNDLPRGGWFARLIQTVKDWLASLIGISNKANAAGEHNYCSLDGSTTSNIFYDSNKKKTNVSFLLKSPLEPTVKYYVILKGDEQLNSKSGILSADKVGFKGQNLTEVSEFNGKIFANSQIWSFTTGEEVCLVEGVTVNPSQHLFRKANEAYDFTARILSSAEREIQSTDVYAWRWSWGVDDGSVASITPKASPDDYLATATAGNKTDASTIATAKATIIIDAISPLSTVGQVYLGTAKLIVFLCENPWPTITDPDAWPIHWSDKTTNCTLCVDPISGNKKQCDTDCIDNDFSIYYCRDANNAGSKDDLPVLDNNSPIRGTYQYRSNDKWVEVLKDYYFFRGKLPQAPSGLKVENSSSQLGGSAKVSWDVTSGQTYKVYYGPKSKQYTGFKQASGSPLTVDKLINGRDYYFAVTVLDSQKNESAYSDEVKLLVTDITAPAKPTEVQVSTQKASTGANIVAKWKLIKEDVSGYVLEYGPNPTPAVKLNLGLTSEYKIEGLNNLTQRDYYLKLYAQDKAGNKSAAVSFKCQKDCPVTSCPCVSQ